MGPLCLWQCFFKVLENNWKYSSLEETGLQKLDPERMEDESGRLGGLGKLLGGLFQDMANVAGDRDIDANFSLVLDKL